MGERAFAGKFFSVAFLGSFLFSNVFVHRAEANFWEDRLDAGRRDPRVSGKPELGPVSHAFLRFPRLGASASLSSNVRRNLPAGVFDQHAGLFGSLSASFGSIRKVIRPPTTKGDKPLILHIQDVHGNEEAQRNISETLKALMETGQVDLVALEGAWDPIRLQPYRDYPNPRAVAMTADFLLKENKISGPVHAALTVKNAPPPFLGVDDSHHYAANVRAYLEAAPAAEKIQAAVRGKIVQLEGKKKTVFSRELLEFDRRTCATLDGRLPLGDYVNAFPVGSLDSSVLRDFRRAVEMETRLDFHKVEIERTRLIQGLVSRVGPLDLSALTADSAAYQAGQIRYAEFYHRLTTLCERYGMGLSSYPSLDAYVRYLLLVDAIDGDRLREDLDALIEKTYARLATKVDEQALVRQARRVYLLGKLAAFALTPSEWNEYDRGGRGSSVDGLGDLSMSAFESFYEEAQSRDDAMSRALLAAVEGRTVRTVVLVTGGFHSAGMAKRLTQAGATVVSYVPKITKVDPSKGSAYLSVFSREKTPLEKLFQGEKLFLAQRPDVALAGGGALTVVGADRSLDPMSNVSERTREAIVRFLGRALGRKDVSVTFEGKKAIFGVGDKTVNLEVEVTTHEGRIEIVSVDGQVPRSPFYSDWGTALFERWIGIKKRLGPWSKWISVLVEEPILPMELRDEKRVGFLSIHDFFCWDSVAWRLAFLGGRGVLPARRSILGILMRRLDLLVFHFRFNWASPYPAAGTNGDHWKASPPREEEMELSFLNGAREKRVAEEKTLLELQIRSIVDAFSPERGDDVKLLMKEIDRRAHLFEQVYPDSNSKEILTLVQDAREILEKRWKSFVIRQEAWKVKLELDKLQNEINAVTSKYGPEALSEKVGQIGDLASNFLKINPPGTSREMNDFIKTSVDQIRNKACSRSNDEYVSWRLDQFKEKLETVLSEYAKELPPHSSIQVAQELMSDSVRAVPNPTFEKHAGELVEDAIRRMKYVREDFLSKRLNEQIKQEILDASQLTLLEISKRIDRLVADHRNELDMNGERLSDFYWDQILSVVRSAKKEFRRKRAEVLLRESARPFDQLRFLKGFLNRKGFSSLKLLMEYIESLADFEVPTFHLIRRDLGEKESEGVRYVSLSGFGNPSEWDPEERGTLAKEVERLGPVISVVKNPGLLEEVSFDLLHEAFVRAGDGKIVESRALAEKALAFTPQSELGKMILREVDEARRPPFNMVRFKDESSLLLLLEKFTPGDAELYGWIHFEGNKGGTFEWFIKKEGDPTDIETEALERNEGTLGHGWAVRPSVYEDGEETVKWTSLRDSLVADKENEPTHFDLKFVMASPLQKTWITRRKIDGKIDTLKINKRFPWIADEILLELYRFASQGFTRELFHRTIRKTHPAETLDLSDWMKEAKACGLSVEEVATGGIGVAAAGTVGLAVWGLRRVLGLNTGGVREFLGEYVRDRSEGAENNLNGIVALAVGMAAGLGPVYLPVVIAAVWIGLFLFSHLVFKPTVEKLTGRRPDFRKALSASAYFLVPIVLAGAGGALAASSGAIFIAVASAVPVGFCWKWMTEAHRRLNDDPRNRQARIILDHLKTQPLSVNAADRLVTVFSDAGPVEAGVGPDLQAILFATPRDLESSFARANLRQLMTAFPKMILVTKEEFELEGVGSDRILSIPTSFGTPNDLGEVEVSLARVIESPTFTQVREKNFSFLQTSLIRFDVGGVADTNVLEAVRLARVLLSLFKTMVPAASVDWKGWKNAVQSVRRSA